MIHVIRDYQLKTKRGNEKEIGNCEVLKSVPFQLEPDKHFHWENTCTKKNIVT